MPDGLCGLFFLFRYLCHSSGFSLVFFAFFLCLLGRVCFVRGIDGHERGCLCVFLVVHSSFYPSVLFLPSIVLFLSRPIGVCFIWTRLLVLLPSFSQIILSQCRVFFLIFVAFISSLATFSQSPTTGLTKDANRISLRL